MADDRWFSRTRGGTACVVYAEGVEDNREDFGPRTIHGAIWQKNHWAPFAWMSTGRAFDGGSHDLDLVAVEDVLESEGAV